MAKKNQVFLVAGLGFGDESKGSIVDYLVRRENARVVIRYNGGAQAAHRVVLSDGREHVFAQFGSGTFVVGTLTHLSRFVLIEPFGMMNEARHLADIGCGDAFERTTIDERAPVITPFHIAANRILELARGARKHGSCGLGVGEVMEDVGNFGRAALVAGDLRNSRVLREKLVALRDRKWKKIKDVLQNISASEALEQSRSVFEDPKFINYCIERYAEFLKQAVIVPSDYLGRPIFGGEPLIFEGAQGMLLDINFGFYPHVTKTDITYRNAETLLRESGYNGLTRRIGVLRGYFTRHGNGPFVTEDAELSETLPDECNVEHTWQGKFRVGHFDAVAARYAIEAIGGVDELAITNLDRMSRLPEVRVCTQYELKNGVRMNGADELFEVIDRRIQRIIVPVGFDQAWQTRSTETIRNMQPVYLNLHPLFSRQAAKEYAQSLAAILRSSLGIISFGPTDKDKITL